MSRPVTLFTGQWADLPLETLAERAAEWGFDGLELACWGDHMDVARAADDLALVTDFLNASAYLHGCDPSSLIIGVYKLYEPSTGRMVSFRVQRDRRE